MALKMRFKNKKNGIVFVSTASLRSSNKTPIIYVLEQKYENLVYSCKPHFTVYKVGFPEWSLHGLVNVNDYLK